MIELKVNDQIQQVDVEADTPLLWVIREQLNLVGTKFGCGMAQCGACTVHLNGQPIRSCVTPVSDVAGLMTTGSYPRCNKHGLKNKCHNVVIVNQVKLCLLWHCLKAIQILLIVILTLQ